MKSNRAVSMGVLVALAGVASVAAQTGAWGSGNLTGSWQIKVVIPPGASVCPSISPEPCTIAAMATANADGGVVQTAAIPGVSTGHGAWVHTDKRNFTIQSTYFRFGAAGELLGTSVTVTHMELDLFSRHAQGDFTNTLYDLAGNAIGSFNGTATADKIVP